MKLILSFLLIVTFYDQGWGWSQQRKEAQNFIKQKQYPEAIAILEKLSSAGFSRTEKVNLYNTLGECYENIARYDLALETFKKAWQVNKNNLSTKLNLARLYLKIGSFSEAINYYRQVLDRQEKNFPANFGLGEAYAQQMLYKQAEFYYTKALSLNPENTRTPLNLALVDEKLGKFDVAIQILKQLAEQLNQGAYFLYLGKLYLFNNQPEQAIDSFNRARKIDPTQSLNNQLHLLSGLAYLDLGLLNSAEEEFKQILNSDSGDGTAYFLLGLTRYWQKNLSLAEQDWQEALKKNIPSTIKEYLENQ